MTMTQIALVMSHVRRGGWARLWWWGANGSAQCTVRACYWLLVRGAGCCALDRDLPQPPRAVSCGPPVVGM